MYFHISVFVTSALAIVGGAIMAFSPRRFLQLGASIGRLFGMRPPEVQLDGRWLWDWRIAGLLIFSFGSFIAGLVLKALFLGPNRSTGDTGLAYPQATGLDWAVLVGELLMLLVGAYVVAKARSLFERMQVRAGIAVKQDSTSRNGVLIFRLVGLIWVAGALVSIYHSLAGR